VVEKFAFLPFYFSLDGSLFREVAPNFMDSPLRFEGENVMAVPFCFEGRVGIFAVVSRCPIWGLSGFDPLNFGLKLNSDIGSF